MPQPPASVTAAIAAAARATGASASYLTATAQRESSFDPNAKAATSSASGLFQFIESTWLSTLSRHAEDLGLGDVAALPREDALQLRFDPALAALMAGALASDNAEALTAALGRAPNDGELYAAHVLGAGGATELIQARDADPKQAAADLFPAAARANKNLFFDPQGRAVSVDALYDRLAKHLGGSDAPSGAASPSGGSVAGGAAAPVSAFGFSGGGAFSGALKLTPQTLEILGLLRAPDRADTSDDRSDGRPAGRAGGRTS